MKYIKWICFSVIALAVLTWGAKYGYYIYLNNLPPESRYLIPEGYVGWATIHYLEKDYPTIPIEEGMRIIKISPTGIYKTSYSPMKERAAKGRYGSEYFYYSGDKLTPVPNDLIDWRGNVGRVDDNDQYYEFMIRLWVGTQEQYAKYGMKDYSNPKPGPVFPLKSDNKSLNLTGKNSGG